MTTPWTPEINVDYRRIECNYWTSHGIYNKAFLIALFFLSLYVCVWCSSTFIVTYLFNERTQYCSFTEWLIVVNFFKSFKLVRIFFVVFICLFEHTHQLNWFKFIRLFIYGFYFCLLFCNWINIVEFHWNVL